MRRSMIAALMMMLVLLSACGGHANEEKFAKFRTDLNAASEIKMKAQITANYGDNVRNYSLYFTRTTDGSAVEVLAPEIIAGIKAHIESGGSTLEYDGLILDTGDLADDGLTPISALFRLMDTAQSGHVDNIWREGDRLAVKLTPDDVIEVTIWLDAETMEPRKAELISQGDGRVLIACEISEFETIT